MLYSIIAFSIAATCALALSPFLFPISRILGAIDVPLDSRRMHSRPVSRLGGLSVFFGFLTGAAIELSLPLVVGSLVIVSIGIIDDIYRIDAYRKLIFQATAAALAVAAGVRAPVGNPTLSALLAFLWLIALPNAFNLIDGLDGLCARVAIFSSLALFTLGGSSAAAALCGATLGFLPYNLRPARMFLGDTGALFIGFSLGVISLDALSKLPTPAGAVSVLLIFALPLADASTAFLRRAAKGKNPFSPDREHFHHKLIDRGFSHKEASLILSLVSLALCSIATAI